MINNNVININEIEKIEDINILREELLKFPGVGPKVADCIMLFSMKKYNVFPIDVWVKRVMNELYGNEITECRGGRLCPPKTTLNPNNKQILEYAENKFGDLAGLAQQYLFYWRRDLK